MGGAKDKGEPTLSTMKEGRRRQVRIKKEYGRDEGQEELGLYRGEALTREDMGRKEEKKEL